MQGRSLGVLLGLVAGTTAGCLVELELRQACGDGHHDPRFEECDPADPSSFDTACAEDEIPTCNPRTCELHCGFCGDGRLDEGEACDGNAVLTLPPCQGWTCVACQVDCPTCGNAELDADEQCDIVLNEPQTTRCEDVEVFDKHFLPGGVRTCGSDCQWNLSQCTVCGDGEVDRAIPGVAAEEECDGNAVNRDNLIEQCKLHCAGLEQEGLACAYSCSSDCLIYVEGGTSDCCVLSGNTRSETFPCCCELPPGERPVHCTGNIDGLTPNSCPG
ncbi:hypothetical protein OEB96_20320 [Paraliomyxa miuraensis]|nr:hypothetical protein [Paraliomyxa miuraensis]